MQIAVGRCLAQKDQATDRRARPYVDVVFRAESGLEGSGDRQDADHEHERVTAARHRALMS